MRSPVKRVLVAAGITLAISVATALPAAAATSGSETVRGVIVASGVLTPFRRPAPLPAARRESSSAPGD